MSTSSRILRGMTWAHTRGYVSMVATAQRFNELHPEVEVVWEKRSLRAFEEFPIEQLAREYDLIVLDHPFVGYAAQHGPLLPLDEHLPADFLANQAENSVGVSHASYHFGGHQWALAVDAAAPVAFWRQDLLTRLRLEVPGNWDELMALARRGHVEVPAAPINCLMNFYMLCVALGETPFASSTQVVSSAVGGEALARLRELVSACHPGCWERNPIASHDLAARAENTQIVYCPFAYGYSNDARAGYADQVLTFGEPPRFKETPLQSTLGGTGLAVSALRPPTDAAVEYARYVASERVQRTVYAQAGGQPGHRLAWTDRLNNELSGNYFLRTLPALERAYLRPRYSGHVEFQQAAGPLVHGALRGALRDGEVLEQLHGLYRESLTPETVLS